MKKVSYHNLLIAVASAMLASCSSDSDAPIPASTDGAMSFSISVAGSADSNGSRAAGATPESNIITIGNFAERSPFFRLMMAEQQPNGTWINNNDWVVNFPGMGWRSGRVKGDAQPGALNNTQYAQSDFYHHQYFWNKNLHHFYAIAGFANDYRGEGIPTLTGTDKGWCVQDFCNWCYQPMDLLWSFREEHHADGNNYDKPVPLTFHHAMSQLLFKFRNDNPNIKVEVYDVYVGNVYRCATLSLNGAMSIVMPADKNWREYVPTEEDYKRINSGNLGNMWFDHKMQAMHCNTHAIQTIVMDGYVRDEITAMSAAGGVHTLLEIPQQIMRWDHTNPNHVALTKWDTSANFGFNGYSYREKNDRPQYLVINCKITDKNTGMVLWQTVNFDDENNAAHKDAGSGIYIKDYQRLSGIIVPLTNGNDGTATWLPGRSYTYHITFGNGAGYDSNGDPTVVPVNMYATIRDFESRIWQNIPASPAQPW